MKKYIRFFPLILFMPFFLNAQTVGVEKLTTSSGLQLVMKEGISGIGPTTILVDEVEQYVVVSEYISNRAMKFTFANKKLREENVTYPPTDAVTVCKIGEYEIGSSETCFQIRKNGKQIAFLRDPSDYVNGKSFILKSNGGYVVFFVNETGAMRAIDTNGKIYRGKERLAILNSVDSTKYEESVKRAEELGLETMFLEGKVLLWGRTLFGSPYFLEEYWKKPLFPKSSGQIQYDLQGNGYQASLNSKSGEIWIVNPNAEYLEKINVTKFSKILDTYERGRIFTTSTYVGFGGNIYFYVAGEDFTEVFRIRRTWGDPDMYAMAINGYTKDAYGQYVDKVLEKMSKDDLRLLRNHVFALYGYVFKDAALNGYFDKLVWYLTKPEVNLDTLVLPDERKALVDRVLEEEKKR